MTLITPVIMSGGAGSRLWPVSRIAKPKQLHALTGDKTLLRDTLDRLAAAPDVFSPPVVVCSAAHECVVSEQLADMRHPPRLILEPMGRNTAACAAVVAYWIADQGDAARLVLLAPADHLVSSAGAFAEALRRAIPAAREGRLVSLGIRPTHPETGYGYIRLGEPYGEVFEAAQFVEKPDRQTAERYLDHGGYLWNGGYFLFRADRMIEEMERLAPEIAARAREAVTRARPTADGGLLLDSETSPRPLRIRSTTRSWRKPTASPSRRSTPAGATSDRGPRCGRTRVVTKTAMPCWAMSWPSARRAVSSVPTDPWSPRWRSRTW